MGALSAWMPVSFQGDSMLPTLVAGDRLLVKRTQNDTEHKRGDIVFFRDPRGLSNTLIIKRIIGLPGESVRASRLVYINGELLKEPYLHDDIEEVSQSARGVNQIRDASYFVMGDNRRASTDSRDFGVINASEILGTAILRYLPIIRFTKLNRHH
jgi:signal peptidase I